MSNRLTSFLTGVARLLDWWGQFNSYTVSSTPEIDDARAIASDWRAVGDSIADALGGGGRVL